MFRSRLFLALNSLYFASTLLLVAGCGGGGEGAGGLNNTIADAQKKIMASEKKVEDLVEFARNQEEYKDKRKAAAEEFSTIVAESRQRFNAVAMPTLDSGKKFHAGFDDYLKVQEEAAPLYKVILMPGGKFEGKEEEKVREDISQMRKKREMAAMRLPGLQQAYVREAGLKLQK